MLIIYGDTTMVNSVYTYVYGLYYTMRRECNYAMASAMSYFLFVIILIITLIQFRVQNGRPKWMTKLIDKAKRVKGEENVETV